MTLLDKASLYIAAFAVGSVGLGCLKGFMAIADAEASSPGCRPSDRACFAVSPASPLPSHIAGER